jgi:sulfonate transport system substrate-binding protein
VRDNRALTATVLQALTATAEKAGADHQAVAAVLARSTGMSQDVWSRALADDPFQVLPMNDQLIASQQKVADRFRAAGLVPVDIKVADIVWRAGA